MALIQSVFFRGAPVKEAAAARVDRGTAASYSSTNASARWGQLEYMSLALDRPVDYFTNDPPREKTVWVFHGLSEPELGDFFKSLNLDADSLAFLADRSHWEPIPSGFRITPPPSVVVNFSAGARQKLYDLLARFPENVPQRQPFLFQAKGFDLWFDECGLATNKVELVRRLTYERQGNLCFSDAALFSELSTPAETMCLVKALWRVSTFMMYVRITPATDLNGLVGYWGKAGRAEAYRPMLEALSRIDGGTALPISTFLPAFARMRLYTYPRPNDLRAEREDCFWSAMNFFNEVPDDRYFDPNETRRALKEDYARVDHAPREFGDTLLLVGAGNRALHMCIYIADDVVFTKNGFAAAQPWVLMKLQQMLGSYENERPFDLTAYRRKDFLRQAMDSPSNSHLPRDPRHS